MFLMCSINVYPFEPHPALQVLAVVLIVIMAGVVGFVYEEMHRDPILGRLTSTKAGELGWDFWLKFISAGAIPVFSLLAVQFPEIGSSFFRGSSQPCRRSSECSAIFLLLFGVAQ